MDELRQLKIEGHYLLNEYVKSTLKVFNNKHYHKQKRKAYHRLAEELHTDKFKCHFSNMNTKEEIIKAINILKSWTKGE